MNILIDMNSSPAWVTVFTHAGWNAVHWSSVGDPTAKDSEPMAWAKEHESVVFTHDLDFGHTLAMTHATAPSVIQVRAEDPFPDILEGVVIETIRQYEQILKTGALITIDPRRSRVKLLPF